MQLTEKLAIVTGSTSGMGYAIAEALAPKLGPSWCFTVDVQMASPTPFSG